MIKLRIQVYKNGELIHDYFVGTGSKLEAAERIMLHLNEMTCSASRDVSDYLSGASFEMENYKFVWSIQEE